ARRPDADKPNPPLTSLILRSEDPAAQAAAERAGLLSAVVDRTRDLVNPPPNRLSPAEFARRTEQVTEGLPLTVTVLDEKQLAEGGYGGIIGVGQGSARPPRLIRIEYAPEGASSSVSLVGKGIT